MFDVATRGLPVLLLFGVGAAFVVLFPGHVWGDGDEVEAVVLEEVEPLKACVEGLDLKGAKKAYAEAKKNLKDRAREEEVKSALEEARRQLDALEEFEKAQKLVEKRNWRKALGSTNRVLRDFGDIWFTESAVELHAAIKARVFYVINDFETEEFRKSTSFGVYDSTGSAEVVRGVEVSSEGLYGLRVKLDARPPGLPAGEEGSYRAVHLDGPTDFGRRLEAYRAVTFTVGSSRKVPDLIGVDIIGAPVDDQTGDDSHAVAKYPGIALNFVGQKRFTLMLNRFQFYQGFQWSQAQSIQFSTEGPRAVEFTIDDVQLVP